MLQREQRAALVQAVLEKKRLTRHAAHSRIDISRPAMDKLWDGRDVELEIVERFARGFGLDVNEWRQHWGYEPVEPSHVETRPGQLPEGLIGRHESPRQRYHRRIGEAVTKYGAEGYKLPTRSELFQSGGDWREDSKADAAFMVWLEELADLNPGKPVPELEEAE